MGHRFKRTISLVTIIFLAGQGGTLAAAQAFEFSGLNLQLSLEEIKARYPRSSPTEAVVDEGFSMHVPPEDVRQDHIHFLSVTKKGAVVTRLDVGFEAPATLEAQASVAEHEVRHPACVDVRQRLVSKFGPWTHIVEYAEESLAQTAYTWCQEGQFMRLHCGRYQWRAPVFAESLAIGNTSTDRDARTLGGCH